MNGYTCRHGVETEEYCDACCVDLLNMWEPDGEVWYDSEGKPELNGCFDAGGSFHPQRYAELFGDYEDLGDIDDY